jgi:hypothetical protein
MKAHTVPVFKGRRPAYPAFRRLYPADADKGSGEYGRFCRNLSLVGKVLEGTAAAAAIEGALWRLPVRGRLQDFQEFPFGPGFVLSGYASPDTLTRGGEFHKDSFAFNMGNSRPAGGDALYMGRKCWTVHGSPLAMRIHTISLLQEQ